ncbi:hypothetical protein F5Y14DRAFT_80911 [Nemania sp. NC0429]|nr:hypothetical protein F5Y14DRAFT_80911 [Nemania sp. NC0429]
MDRHRFSSLGALKKHIRKAHNVQPAESYAGGLSAREDQATAKYWKDMHNYIKGTAGEPYAPRKMKAVLKENALIAINSILAEDDGKAILVKDDSKDNLVKEDSKAIRAPATKKS